MIGQRVFMVGGWMYVDLGLALFGLHAGLEVGNTGDRIKSSESVGGS